jgi:hypothetical protein
MRFSRRNRVEIPASALWFPGGATDIHQDKDVENPPRKTKAYMQNAYMQTIHETMSLSDMRADVVCLSDMRAAGRLEAAMGTLPEDIGGDDHGWC